MALTFGNVEILEQGAWKQVFADISGDSAYLVGGEAVTAADFGLTHLKRLVVAGSTSGVEGVYERTDDDSGLFKVYVTGDATTSAALPVESSVRDLSTTTFFVIAYGR